MQFTFAREVLSRCIGDVDEMGKKILPKNGNRRERMSTFLQFILQEDNNVIEFENILKNNGLGDRSSFLYFPHHFYIIRNKSCRNCWHCLL